MRDEFLPYGRQWIDEADIAAVAEVLRSDYLTTGPKVGEFEKRFADYVGANYAVSIANGTAALHAACFAAGIGPGDEVITTPITFAASANCVLYCGGTPVFADINPHTYNIDPGEIRKKLTKRTKAIIPVHFTGQPCRLAEIHAIAKEHNLLVVEDAAHALGAEYGGQLVGGLSDMSTFSFHPVKHITTGEGGMITTNNEDLFNKLSFFRSHGITRDKANITHYQGPWYYEQQVLGYNYRLTDMQAALGLSQLKKLDNFLQRRRAIAEVYSHAFKEISGLVITPFQEEGCNSSWHLYVIQIKLENLYCDRKQIVEELAAENIGTNVHYIPVYKHPYYQENGYNNIKCPEAEKLYERIISLPIFPKMDDQAVKDVIQSVTRVLERNAK